MASAQSFVRSIGLTPQHLYCVVWLETGNCNGQGLCLPNCSPPRSACFAICDAFVCVVYSSDVPCFATFVFCKPHGKPVVVLLLLLETIKIRDRFRCVALVHAESGVWLKRIRCVALVRRGSGVWLQFEEDQVCGFSSKRIRCVASLRRGSGHLDPCRSSLPKTRLRDGGEWGRKGRLKAGSGLCELGSSSRWPLFRRPGRWL